MCPAERCEPEFTLPLLSLTHFFFLFWKEIFRIWGWHLFPVEFPLHLRQTRSYLCEERCAIASPGNSQPVTNSTVIQLHVCWNIRLFSGSGYECHIIAGVLYILAASRELTGNGFWPMVTSKPCVDVVQGNASSCKSKLCPGSTEQCRWSHANIGCTCCTLQFTM